MIISGHLEEWPLIIEFTRDLDFGYSVWHLPDSDLDIHIDIYVITMAVTQHSEFHLPESNLDFSVTFNWVDLLIQCDIYLTLI